MMMDPYEVLGLKRAYRTMSRKYHPDANVNNPNAAQAEEKFKQVQAAYEQIMREKEQGYSGYGDASMMISMNKPQIAKIAYGAEGSTKAVIAWSQSGGCKLLIFPKIYSISANGEQNHYSPFFYFAKQQFFTTFV